MYKSDTIHRKVISSALRRERCHCLIWSLHCWIVRVTLNPPHWDGKKVFQSYTDPEFIYIGAVLYKAWSNPSYWSTAITTLAVVVGDPKLFLAWGSDRSRETKRIVAFLPFQRSCQLRDSSPSCFSFRFPLGQLPSVPVPSHIRRPRY